MPYKHEVLTSLDRWRIQSAVQVTVRMSGGASIRIAQQVPALIMVSVCLAHPARSSAGI